MMALYDEFARPTRIGRHFYHVVNGRLWPHVAGADGDEGTPIDGLIELVERAENGEALEALSLDEVRQLRADLQAGFDEVRPTVNDQEGVAALTRVVEAIQAVDARLETLSSQEDEIQAELDRLAAEVHTEDASGEEETPTEPEGDDGEGEDESGEGEAGAEAGEGAGQESRVAASARRGGQRPSLSALRGTRRAEPEPEPEQPRYRVLASAQFPNVPAATELSLETLGTELQQLHQSMQTLTPEQLPNRGNYDPRTGETVRAGGRKLVLGRIPIVERPGVVHMERGDGSEIIDQAVREHALWRDEQNRRVASGGDCVMALPDYSINVVGDRGTCFTDDLPTVAGIRPLAYYPYLKIDQSAGATGPGSSELAEQGIGFVTSEQDEAGYGNPDADPGDPDEIPTGGTAYKSCVHIDCPPEPLTCSQEAVYKCLTFGNFQAISHPEYVNAFTQYTDIWFDIERDNRALDAFTAAAVKLTEGTGDNDFGAVLSLRDIFHRLLAHERSARHAPNLSFNVVAPDWFGGFLALDVMRHTFGSLDNLRATQAEALALASTDGIRMSTYCTEAGPTAGDNIAQVLTPIAAGAVPAWPATARLLMYADGAVFKKTAGDLQFGLRETLMKTNDFGTFMEVFEKVCFRDDVYVLDVTLCPNGATGGPVALTC